MDLTSGDIRRKVFKKQVFGGYNTQEVERFLQDLSEEHIKLSEKNKLLQLQLAESKETILRVQGVEEALLHALEKAEKQGEEIILQSKKEAEVRVLEGQVAAEALINTAKQKAQQMLQEVKLECETKMQRMQADFDLLDHSYQEVEEHVEKVIKQMQRFIASTNEQLAHLSTLKNQKALEGKIVSSKQLLELHNGSHQDESSKPSKAQKDTSTEKSASSSTKSQESSKPRTLHESLRQSSHKKEDDMHTFFRQIDTE